MLDMFVFKWCEHGSYRLAWKPFVQESARHVPLSQTSCHAPSVHRSWPVGEIRRMHARSLVPRHFKLARDAKVGRFQEFFMDSEIIRSTVRWVPPIGDISSHVVALEPPDPCRIVRLILPFSRKWSGLAQKVAAIVSLWQSNLLSVGLNVRVQVSYSSGGVPLWSLLRARVSPNLKLMQAFRSSN